MRRLAVVLLVGACALAACSQRWRRRHRDHRERRCDHPAAGADGRARGHADVHGPRADARRHAGRLPADPTRRRTAQPRVADLRVLRQADHQRARRPLDGARRGVDHLHAGLPAAQVDILKALAGGRQGSARHRRSPACRHRSSPRRGASSCSCSRPTTRGSPSSSTYFDDGPQTPEPNTPCSPGHHRDRRLTRHAEAVHEELKFLVKRRRRRRAARGPSGRGSPRSGRRRCRRAATRRPRGASTSRWQRPPQSTQTMVGSGASTPRSLARMRVIVGRVRWAQARRPRRHHHPAHHRQGAPGGVQLARQHGRARRRRRRRPLRRAPARSASRRCRAARSGASSSSATAPRCTRCARTSQRSTSATAAAVHATDVMAWVPAMRNVDIAFVDPPYAFDGMGSAAAAGRRRHGRRRGRRPGRRARRAGRSCAPRATGAPGSRCSNG